MPDAAATGCTVVGAARWAAEADLLRPVVPLDHVAVLAPATVAAAVPDAEAVVRRRGAAAGTPAALVPVRDAASAVEAVGAGAAAVYLADLAGSTLSDADVGALVARLTARGLPVVASDTAHVTRHGALAASAPSGAARARTAALAVEAALTDAPAAAVAARPALRLTLHRRTADRLGLRLPWSVRLSARLVGAPAPDAPPLSLADAMRQSMQANLELKAERLRVDADANRVDEARGRLLPQVNARATGTTVSDDLARASLGNQPERLLTSALTLRQVVFSEPAFANLSVQKRRQAVRAFEEQATRLDAAEAAATAYLRVLRARAAAAIQRENVEVVRTNLDAARTRRRAGAAGPRAVSRLETQLAQAEQGLLAAMGRARQAEVAFNRVLDRPLDAPVVLDHAAGADPAPVLDRFPYADLLGRRGAPDAFTAFWVEEARTRAPEVQAVERLVDARARVVTSADRAFWMPELALEGAVSQRVIEDGIGVGPPNLNLPNQGGGSPIPGPPNQQWSLSLTATFPLFDGTRRAAQRREAQDDLKAARVERLRARLGVEARARTALIDLETAHARYHRAARAAEAAARTLATTQAAYRQGTASLLDLIDAQTTALTARRQASDTAYDVLLHWTTVQRASGSFATLRSGPEQAAFLQRLHAFVPATPDAHAR
jgi:outer membrane protein TolC